MADIQFTFRQPFPEQLAALRLRLGNLVPTRAWDDLMHQAHDRAFVVAGAIKADLLADLAGAVEKAVAQGTTLEQFRKDFRGIVETHGWHGWTGEGTKKGEAWRTRVIYETNIRTSYAAGRRAQLEAGNFRYWVYRHGGSREPRLQHLAWDKMALPPDHPFWVTHAPPNGWGCSCRIFGARSTAGIRRVGGDPDKQLPPGWDAINPRAGTPVGIDRGWDYAPGASIAAEINRLVGAKTAALPPPLAEALGAHAEKRIAETNAATRKLLEEVAGFDGASAYSLAPRLDEPRLTIGERAVVATYTTDFYDRVNRHLRRRAEGPEPEDPSLETYARMLERALAKLPAYQGDVRRGLNFAPEPFGRLAALDPGAVITLAGFTSASRTEPFLGNVQLTIRSRTGRYIEHLSLAPGEEEVLFARGLQYRILERTLNDGVLSIVLQEMDPREWRRITDGLFFAHLG